MLVRGARGGGGRRAGATIREACHERFRPHEHTHDGELAVFLIGMRVNHPWRPDLWGPVFAAGRA